MATWKNLDTLDSFGKLDVYKRQVHGNTPAEVAQDEEGLQIMRSLGNNMAWLLKSLEAGKAAGIAVPQAEDKIKTNFIR